ncbi:hypothetical protein TNCV_2671601 [Trichonephila clavipes]|nr:hypothetical protein TNCV_2671601 [Trichonephila clavipes]
MLPITHLSEILNAIDDDFTLMHLPPNVTALVQLMDQGVIEKLKRIYRKQVLQTSLLAENDEESVVAFLLKAQYEGRLLHDSGLARTGISRKQCEDYGFQILNNDEIVVFVQEESDPVDDETDKDEDNNNESDKAPSNADAFFCVRDSNGINFEQKGSAFLLNYCCSRESETLRYEKRRCTMVQ